VLIKSDTLVISKCATEKVTENNTLPAIVRGGKMQKKLSAKSAKWRYLMTAAGIFVYTYISAPLRGGISRTNRRGRNKHRRSEQKTGRITALICLLLTLQAAARYPKMHCSITNLHQKITCLRVNTSTYKPYYISAYSWLLVSCRR